jgi:hypothetical protein
VNYELIGYVASVLVAVSLMMSSILRLRIINLVGAALFAFYGILIGSAPVAIVNIFIVIINVYYLFRIFGAREYFRILEVSPESEYLRHFLEFNRDDILKYEPLAVTQPLPHQVTVFVLRGVIPAGLVIGERMRDGSFLIHLDYVLPGYRDFKVGDFLYRRAEFFRERGISRIVTRGDRRAHTRYLRRMGFTREAEGRWTRSIDS